MVNERRKFTRIELDATLYVEFDTVRYLGVLHDISLNGALIEIDGDRFLQPSDECLLEIIPHDGRPVLKCDAELVYLKSEKLALIFKGLDPDNRQQLGDLLESFIGKEQLERELHELVQLGEFAK